MRRSPVLIPVIALLIAWHAAAAPNEISVAAASDLRFAMEELVSEFRASHGIDVNVSYGSSGNFLAQIENGAPFDVFFSADAEYPRRLERDGFAESGASFQYGVGRLVVWAPKGSRVDVARLGLKAAAEPAIQRIAIANPAHAPYGRAAEAALRSQGLLETVRGKLVLGENIAQAAQFVESGAADLGILALSLALAPRMQEAGRYVEVPGSAFPRIDQAGIVLKAAKDPKAANAFREFVVGARGQAILKRFGFAPPVE